MLPYLWDTLSPGNTNTVLHCVVSPPRVPKRQREALNAFRPYSHEPIRYIYLVPLEVHDNVAEVAASSCFSTTWLQMAWRGT